VRLQLDRRNCQVVDSLAVFAVPEPIGLRSNLRVSGVSKSLKTGSMKFCRFFLIGIAAAIALFLCGCAEMPSRFQQAVAALPIPSGWWNDDGAHGPSRIVVHLTEQKAYFYKGKILVGESTVSTGKPGFSTPQGDYSVGSKDRDHYSSEFGDYVNN
jgi:hypothetical protein